MGICEEIFQKFQKYGGLRGRLGRNFLIGLLKIVKTVKKDLKCGLKLVKLCKIYELFVE